MLKSTDRAQDPFTLLLCKVLFFNYFGFLAAFIPFIPLFLKAAGGTQVQIGIISAVRPFLGFISMPLVGLAADKLNRHKLFLLVLIACTALLRAGLIWCTSLVAVATLILISDFSGNPISSILDSTVLDALPDPLLYGRQRLWGTLGWGSMAPLAGQAIAAAGTAAAGSEWRWSRRPPLFKFRSADLNRTQHNER